MGVSASRGAVTLYSDASDQYSHRIRIVMAEKNVPADVRYIDAAKIPVELSELNPYHSLPTLVDRDLVLYESAVIMEYLEERFPHPPLLPVYPVERAEIRQFLQRIHKDWCPAVDLLCKVRKGVEAKIAAKELLDGLVTVAPIFIDRPYFMSDEFSLVDCCLAPILWRLSLMGIQLPDSRQVVPLVQYMQRVFNRPGFRRSLTELERSYENLKAEKR